MSKEYADAVRSAVESAVRQLREGLTGFEQTTHARLFVDNDIGTLLYSLGEAYRTPNAYTVSNLSQAVDHFLQARPERVPT